MEAFNHLLGVGELDLAKRFVHHERQARQSFAIRAALPEASAYRDDSAFFEAVGVEVRRRAGGCPSIASRISGTLRTLGWRCADRWAARLTRRRLRPCPTATPPQ